MKPAIRTTDAQADVVAAVDWYTAEAPHVAAGFIDALEKAVARIERNPGAGSPRYAHELDIPRLRFWQLAKFPYALFYVEHADHLDVIRVVHMSRDIPGTLQSGE